MQSFLSVVELTELQMRQELVAEAGFGSVEAAPS